MTIIDILIYVAFAFFASSLAKKSENYIEENDISPMQWDRYLTFFVLFFTVIGGIRWNVGSDSISYATIFAYREVNFETNEKLWAYFVYLIQNIGLHWTIGLALCAFIQILFIVKSFQPYRWLLIFIPFVIFGGRYWIDCMNAVRQMIVSCAFLWASIFITNQRFVPYLIFVVISSLIHQSALLLLPLYFIPKHLDITERRGILIIILLGCVAFGQMAQLSGLSGSIQIIASATDYDSYGDGMADMLQSGYTKEALSFGPMMLSYLLIPLFIIWFGKELKEEYSEKIPCFYLWYNLSFIYSCVYFLICNLGHIFIRPTMYLSLFQMAMGALLLRYLWTEYVKFGLRQVATFAFCCIIAINTVWDTYKASGMFFESSTYKVSFFHKDQQKWFRL